MSKDSIYEVAITGENACVVLWIAQAIITKGARVVINEEYAHLADQFFGKTSAILCLRPLEMHQRNVHSHILVYAKSDQQELVCPTNSRFVIAGIGLSPDDLSALAVHYNPHRTIGADIVFGPGCHSLPNSGLTKSIGSAFNGTGFRLPYTGERCYAYVEDFASAIADALFAPSPSNFSPIQIGERADVDEILRDLEYVFPYNGITANGSRLANIFDDSRLLPHTLLEGIEKSRSILKQMATG